jgi:hypothetical protein
MNELARCEGDGMSRDKREARPGAEPEPEPQPQAAEPMFVARQPIFARDRKLTGYELLFRSGAANVFPVGVDPDQASKDIIGRMLSVFGMKALTGEA